MGKNEELTPSFQILNVEIPSLPDLQQNSQLNVRYPLIAPYVNAHVYFDAASSEMLYDVEEPALSEQERSTLELVEEGIAELINLSVLQVKNADAVVSYLEKNIKVILDELGMKISQDTFVKMMYYVYRDFVCLNEIEPLMRDYFIEDIECNGLNTPLYIVHRKYGNMKTNIIFRDERALESFVEKLAQKCGKYISYARPLLDAALPDGSIDYNEFFIFKEDGVIKIRKIGEFIDKYYSQNESNKPVAVKGFEVPAFDPKNLKISWKPLDYVYRHKINEKLYSLTLETGRKLKLTGNHSIFVLRKDGLKSEVTSNIKEGDYVAIPFNIPENKLPEEINLAKELFNKEYSRKLCLENVPYAIFIEKKSEIRQFLEEHYKHPREAYYELRTKRLLPLNLYTLLSEDQLRSTKIKTTSAVTCPTFLKISKHLMRLLGYYIAEGWLSNPTKWHNYNIQFSMHKNEIAYHQEIVDAFRACFDKDIYIEPPQKNAVKLICNSYILWHIFKDVLKVSKYAKKKVIPDIVFNVNSELRDEFIWAYTNGDYGSSASEQLMSDLLYLHLFNSNIISYYDRERIVIFKNNRPIKSHEYYTNSLVRKKTDYFKQIPIELFNPLKETCCKLNDNKRINRERLRRILNHARYEQIRNVRLVQSVKLFNSLKKRGFIVEQNLTEKGKHLLQELDVIHKLLDSDLAYIRVKKIGKTDSSSEFVYDVSVKDCENFVGGSGGICCHNSRANATFSQDISARGPSFSIRKFTKEPFTPVKLMQMNTVSPEVLAYLWILIEHEANIMVIGATGSGKTSFINSLAFFIPPQARIVSLEDTREINILHENWLPSVSREGMGINEGSEIDLFTLLKESFRQRPDYVIVGEIRGKEAYVLFQGAASGHCILSTMHAEDVQTMIRRLETQPINLSPSLVNSLDVVCSMIGTKVRNQEVRRLKDVTEIVEVGNELGSVATNTPFVWEPRTDTFFFKTESTVFEKIMRQRGLSKTALEREFRVRSALLMQMYRRGIFQPKEVQDIINMYYKNPTAVIERFNITT